MIIKFPTKQGTPNSNPEIECKGLVAIGANGSGKSRLGHKIHKLNSNSVYISSQKSLIIPDAFVLKSVSNAESEFYTGSVTQKTRTSFNSRANLLPKDMLVDYDKLLLLLFAEEAQISTKYRKAQLATPTSTIPKSKLDTVKEIWEQVITHKTLSLDELKVEVSGYSGSEMSDGERLIFYIIGQVVCAKENQIIIIDEPENHLHKAVVSELYNNLERVRQDCIFIYLTHDIDFAFTRHNFKKLWTKSYEGSEIWNYDFLDTDAPIPEQLYLEVLGSRKDILFVEGDNSSIDYSIYSLVFNDYTVKPIEGCEKVMQVVKSFNLQNSFHNIRSFGLIDRDRRNETQVEYLNNNEIWVLEVAEAENLLLLEGIVKTIAVHMSKDEEAVFQQVKENLIAFFNSILDAQVLLHLKEWLRKKQIEASNFSSKDISEVIAEVSTSQSEINIEEEFEKIKTEFQEYITNSDFTSILKVINQKNALIPESKVCTLCGISNRKEYLKLVISLLKKGDSTSETIKSIIKENVKINAT